jgi:hypothetical protein
MALGDVDGCLKGRRECPLDGKDTDEGPEEQAKVYENTDPKDVEPPNRFTVIEVTAEKRRGQLKAPFVTLV